MTHSQETQKVCILGGGNATHVFGGYAASIKTNQVFVCSTYAEKNYIEADELNTGLKKGGGKFEVYRTQSNDSIFGAPKLITTDANIAIQGSDIIIISVPANAHQGYLQNIFDNINTLKQGTIISCFPGAAGLECQYNAIFGDKKDHCILISCATLPWACRTLARGSKVEVLGTKNAVDMALRGDKELIDKIKPLDKLQTIMLGEPKLIDIKGHIISATLGAVNGIVHPSIMYAQWKNWDGKKVEETPLFYQGITQEGADLLSKLSDEILAIADGIRKAVPETKIVVPHIFDWFKASYGKEAEDKSSLLTIIKTNPGYKGLVHPMIKDKQGNSTGFPDFKYRYITEDLPFGIVVFKGLADLVNVKVPLCEEILKWGQNLNGKEYMDSNGNLTGKDLNESRCPQRYGFTKIEQVL